MPTPGQQKLFDELQREFGNTERWTFLLRAIHFETMNKHRASHLLSELISAFRGKRRLPACDCYFPNARLHARSVAITPKDPGADTPSSSDAQTV